MRKGIPVFAPKIRRQTNKKASKGKRFNGSLAKKMISFGILLVLIVIASLQLIALSYSKMTLIDITSKQAKMLAEQHSASIEEWLGELATSIKTTASKRVMTTNLDSLIMEQFSLLKQSHKEIIKIYLVDSTTGNELYSLTSRNNLNFTEKKYFQNALKTKVLTISDEEITKGAERSTLYMATPIGDNNTDTSRILVVGFTIQQLSKKVELIPFMKEGYAFVVRPDGLVTAHRLRQNINQLNLKENAEYNEMFTLMSKNESGSFIYKDNGKTSFAAFSPIPSLKWDIVLTTTIDEVYGEINQMGWFIFLISIPIVGISAGLIWWFAKKIRTSLFGIAQDMQKIGSGDFQVEVKVTGKDELALVGHTMNQMVGELRNLISLVQGQAIQLNVATDELSKHSNENREAINEITGNMSLISEKVSIQAKDVHATVATVTEISHAVEQVAIAAESTTVATTRTFDRAREGREQVENVIKSVRAATDEVVATTKRMHKMRDRAKEITSIVEMISTVASQTNLLALNAAIEAARAGEAGRGFSVVASEVRKLAEDSNVFSEKIALIARSINDEAMEMSRDMDEIVTRVNDGLTAVEAVGESFENIVGDIQAAAEQSEAMSATSEEMAAGNQIVTSSMQRLSSMSSEISNTITGVVHTIDEQLTAISRINENVEQMKELADELTQSVQKFII